MSSELVAADPLSMLNSMIEKGANPDALSKMVDLAERWQKAKAETEFNLAMNACQKIMPTVIKDKENPEIHKSYAPIETVQTYAKPVYIKHGFSLSFGTEIGSEAGLTHVYLDVQHVGGHTKRFYIHNVPLDDKGPKGGAVKTQVQGLMSSLSYAQARLIRLAFNLTVADEDRDGRVGRVTDDQIERINTLIEQYETASGEQFKYQAFLHWLNVKTLDELSAPKAEQAITEIKRKIADLAKGKK